MLVSILFSQKRTSKVGKAHELASIRLLQLDHVIFLNGLIFLQHHYLRTSLVLDSSGFPEVPCVSDYISVYFCLLLIHPVATIATTATLC